MGTTWFPTIFLMGNNLGDFLFASLEQNPSKWGPLLKEKICSHGANSLLQESISSQKGGKMKVASVSSP